MKSRGFTITHGPGTFSAVAMAEAAMAFMLMISRQRNEAVRVFNESRMGWPRGENLEGKVLGLVGFGASAQALAVRARAFDMRVFAVDVREIEPEVLEHTKPEFLGTPDDLDYVIGESDFLSMHLHLNASTRHTIDARRIALMKPTASLINVARGGLVDEEALYDALLAGRIHGAGLDVFADEPPDPTLPVYQLPNVYTTPHTGGTTVNTAQKRAAAMAENVDRIAQGLDPLYQVEPGVNL
jgi:phosphoglycerate dehydrogenase-like enzyme